MNINTAHVSEYAERLGSEYGSPNPSLPVVPTPPVTYIFFSTASAHMRCDVARYGDRPMRTPTSASETISVTQLTAWPTASVCSRTGLYDWLCRLRFTEFGSPRMSR